MNFKHDVKIRRNNLLYWQVNADPGQRITHEYWQLPNRSLRTQHICQSAYGRPCPQHSDVVPNASSSGDGGLLVFSTFGRLTNCILVLDIARWLAEQLGKTLVAPLCSSAENTEQACSAESKQPEHRELNLLIAPTAVYDRISLGGCQQRRQPALDIRDLFGAHFMSSAAFNRSAEAPRKLVCVGRTASQCAWMLTTNFQFVGASLQRYINFDLGAVAHAWAKYAGNQRRTTDAFRAAHAPDALREALKR